MNRATDQQRTAPGRVEKAGRVEKDRAAHADAAPPAGGRREAGGDRRAAFDATHESSARGEHRYGDSHQTKAEQKARDDRDNLKRKLGGKR